MRTFRWNVIVVALFAAWNAHASDAYVYQFLASGKTVGCYTAQWFSDVLFYNQNPEPRDVRLLGLSNGHLPDGVETSWTLPPHQAFSLRRWGPAWGPMEPPQTGARVWVLHLDVPDGVTVESRNEFGAENTCTDIQSQRYNKASQPVVRTLTAANVAQVKLGTDIGTADGRINVAIYNGGTTPAHATIDVHRTCDDSIVVSDSIVIPANTIVQYGPLPTGGGSCAELHTEGYPRYTVITVDQPSFSIVSTLTEGQFESSGDVIPLIELGVNVSSTF